jgi:hypothetical protein
MLWGYECQRCNNWWSCMAPESLYRIIAAICPQCIPASLPEISERQLDERIILESEQIRAERQMLGVGAAVDAISRAALRAV